MKLIYAAPVGARLKKGFWGIQTSSDLWWDKSTRKWVEYSEITGDASNVCPCRSERAFISHLRRHPELKGVEVFLTHRCYSDDCEYWIAVDWETQ